MITHAHSSTATVPAPRQSAESAFTASCAQLSTLTADTWRGVAIRGCLADLAHAESALAERTAWEHLVAVITE